MTNANKPKNLFSGILIGGLIGAAIALLMAPQSGEKTRKMIQEKSIEIRDKTTDSVDESIARAENALNDLRKRMDDFSGKTRKQAEEVVHRGEKELQKQRERLAKIRS